MLATPGKRPTSIEELLPRELAARLDRLDIFSRKVFAGKLQGERRSKRRGQSVEFADHRNYIAGDDLRRIDWNALARLDRLFVKIFQEEEDLALHIVLDGSASMDAGGGEGAGSGGGGGSGGGDGGGDRDATNKLIFGQRLAMALGYIGLVNNNRVAVSVFDGRSFIPLPPARGRRNVQRVAQFLIDALRTPSGAGDRPPTLPGTLPRGDFTAAMRTLAVSQSGRGVLVLVSDFLIPEGYEEGLKVLASASGHPGGGYDVYCVQVLAPSELDPARDASRAGGARGGGDRKDGGTAGRVVGDALLGDLRLVDAESGRETEVTITAEVLQKYRETVRRYIADLAAFCTARGMTHLLVPTDTSVEVLLMEMLRKRGMLR